MTRNSSFFIYISLTLLFFRSFFFSSPLLHRDRATSTSSFVIFTSILCSEIVGSDFFLFHVCLCLTSSLSHSFRAFAAFLSYQNSGHNIKYPHEQARRSKRKRAIRGGREEDVRKQPKNVQGIQMISKCYSHSANRFDRTNVCIVSKTKKKKVFH